MAKTFTWTNALANSVWAAAGNWSVTGSGGASTYPGESVATDNVVFDGAHAVPNPPASPVTLNNLTATASVNIDIPSATGNITINGTLTTVSGPSVSGYLWGVSSALVFTGASIGILNSNDGETGPPSITSAGDLYITCGFNSGSSHDLTGAHINCGGSLFIVGNFANPGDGGVITITDAVIVGPSTPGSVYKAYGETGSPASVTGFEPLFKVGELGATESAYGSGDPLLIPEAADIRAGVLAGATGDEVTGTLDVTTDNPTYRVNTGPVTGATPGEVVELPHPRNVRANVAYGPTSNRLMGTHQT